jgi:hypothetical protein
MYESTPSNLPRVTFSIVTSVFNVNKAEFNWKETFRNWLAFQNGTGQIVIAINKSVDDSPNLIRAWVQEWKMENPRSLTKIDVIDIDIPYKNPEFDGWGKAAATAAATEPYVILLDCDEVLVPSMRGAWVRMATELEMNGNLEAFLVPVVDLIGDERSCRAVNSKWYIHKNLPHITRGVVKWAYREDGSICKEKSDTCECIHKDTKELVKAALILMPGLPMWMQLAQMESGEVPFVYHLGYLDLQLRLKRSEFWRPVWDKRDRQSKEPKITLTDLENMPRSRHNLPSWKEGML